MHSAVGSEKERPWLAHDVRPQGGGTEEEEEEERAVMVVVVLLTVAIENIEGKDLDRHDSSV